MTQTDPLFRATEAQVAAGRRGARFWAWLRKWAGRAKLVGEIIGLVGAMVGAAAKAWVMLRARDISPALPPATGIHTTAMDRVDEPRK